MDPDNLGWSRPKILPSCHLQRHFSKELTFLGSPWTLRPRHVDRNDFWGPGAGDGEHHCLVPRNPFGASKHVPNHDKGAALPGSHQPLALAAAEGPWSQQTEAQCRLRPYTALGKQIWSGQRA